MDRVRKAAAPLKPVLPQKQTGEPDGPRDILWAAKKAAQDAAAAASDMSQTAKAHETRSVPALPRHADMTNWIYSLVAAAISGIRLAIVLVPVSRGVEKDVEKEEKEREKGTTDQHLL